MVRKKESASQTAGPYVHIGLTPNFAGIRGVPPRRIPRVTEFVREVDREATYEPIDTFRAESRRRRD